MSFQDKIKQKKFVVTGEVGPPKGTDLKEMLEDSVLIKDRVDAINVTDLQSSVMRVGSLAICKLLIDHGIEPIFQMTCRDRNRLALQSDLLSAWVLGIKNVLALTGDHPALGDHPDAQPVFDLDSVLLVKTIQTLNTGKDIKGNDLKGEPDFFMGCVVNPGSDNLEAEILKLKKKISAGAQFVQTQAIYDVDLYKKFLDALGPIDVPILAGLVMLKTAGMAKFMNENVAGVFVPDNLIAEMKSVAKEDRPKKSIEITVRLIKELKPICQGVHLMTLGWDKYIPQILDEAGL
jgi:5,10-methylenetetrahydrofolate reductase